MQVHHINKILSEKDYDWINQLSKDYLDDNSTKPNFSWDHTIKEFSQPVYIKGIHDASDLWRVKQSISHHDISPLNKNCVKGALLHYWSPGSYIPWHTDKKYSAGLTIYLNEEWDYQMGGLFNYKYDYGVRTVVPQKNTGVLQVGGVPHSTTITSEKSPIRRTLQIFFDDYKDEVKSIM